MLKNSECKPIYVCRACAHCRPSLIRLLGFRLRAVCEGDGQVTYHEREVMMCALRVNAVEVNRDVCVACIDYSAGTAHSRD